MHTNTSRLGLEIGLIFCTSKLNIFHNLAPMSHTSMDEIILGSLSKITISSEEEKAILHLAHQMCQIMTLLSTYFIE